MPKPASWLTKQFRRLIILLVFAAVIFAGMVLWLWQGETGHFAQQRAVKLEQLANERVQIEQQLHDLPVRLEDLGNQINLQQERARRAKAIIDERKTLVSTWDRWVGDPAGQKENNDQLARLARLHDEALTLSSALTQERAQLVWSRDALQITLARTVADENEVRADDHLWTHCVKVSWKKLRPWYLVAGLLYFTAWPLLGWWWRQRRKIRRKERRS